MRHFELPRSLRRELAQTQLFAKTRSATGHQLVEIGFGSFFADGENGFAFAGILQLHIQMNFASGGLPQIRVGADHHEIRAKAFELSQGALAQALETRHAQVFPHLGALLPGYGAKLVGAAELGSHVIR